MPNNFEHLDTPKETKLVASGKQPLSTNAYPVAKSLGEILDYNVDSDTYEIMTIGLGGRTDIAGEESLHSVPRKVHHEGESAPISNGTTVIIEYTLGFPYIDGILPLNTTRDAVDNSKLPTMGDVGSTLSQVTGDENVAVDVDDYWRRYNTPKDLVAGEYCQSGPDGNYMAVLRGKAIKMFGSEKAQIMALGSKDLIKMISEDFEHFHALGKTEIVNEEGRASLSFRGGSSQLTQSGGSEENWTLEFDLGDRGDIFDLRVLSEDRHVLSRIHLSADGKIEMMGINGIDLVNAGRGPRMEEVGGDYIIKIKGGERKYIDKDASKKVLGNVSQIVSQSNKRITGNDDTCAINRDKIENIGRNLIQTITGGSAATATPANVAVDTSVLNGSYHLKIGPPGLAAPQALAGYQLAVYNGDVVIGADPNPLYTGQRTTVSLNTQLPDSVALGGTTLTSQFHPAMYETLQIFLEALITWMDTHIHPVTAIATPTGIPAVLSRPILSGLVNPIQSQFVKLFG